MKKAEWQKLIATLPPGLTISEAATRLKKNYFTARLWLTKLGYRFSDGRNKPWPIMRRLDRATLDPRGVDWTQSNIDIARRHGVSRERVRQVRISLFKA